MYPNGYPVDDDFVHLGHYIKSSRSSSGYKHISLCDKKRNETWRVKFNSTIGRYFSLAKACEVAYWVAKKKKDAKDLARGDTVIDSMFD